MVYSLTVVPKRGLAPLRRKLGKQAKELSADAGSPRSFSSRRLVLEVLGIQSEDHKAMLARVRAGLPSTVVKVLETAYGCSQAAIADCLLIPLSTLRRRLKKAERLNVDESDRVVRLARIKDLTVDMMQGDDEAAIEWLRTPREILGGESPMEHASTEFGGRAVEDLIGRIRHGVFS